ncbi:SPOR domain-containing protein [bacterium]|nr:SPOR domain-containing protein [bacterium]
MISIEKSGLLKNILLVMGVICVLGVSFVLGLFTGWKLSSSERYEERYEEMPPLRRTVPQKQYTPPSTPIFIIPHKTTPSLQATPSQTKPRIQKPSVPPKPEISITPTNIPQPPKAVTTPPPTSEEAPVESPKKLYKVTIGPMDEEQAKKTQEELKNQGKEAILVPSNGKYKLQIGAFIQKENAQNLVDELKKSGYNAVLEEK